MAVAYAIIFFIVIMIITGHTVTEGFQPGRYPGAVTGPLLEGCYRTTKHPGVSSLGAGQIYKNYPTFPAAHCGTNNLRYWRKPTNGRCAPADMCGNLYLDTPQTEWKDPTPPGWGAGPRVNFYVANN